MPGSGQGRRLVADCDIKRAGCANAKTDSDIAIKMNLLLYRILNEQINMKERSCFVLISS